jgi:hypothetical protein
VFWIVCANCANQKINNLRGIISLRTSESLFLRHHAAIDLQPRLLVEIELYRSVIRVGSAALETEAQRVLAQIFATTVSEVNPFSGPGAFSLLVDPRLDAYSTTAWYLFCDPGRTPILEYSYLSGQEGVYIETRMGFEVDGIEIKSRLDYGTGAVGWRGAVKSLGA